MGDQTERQKQILTRLEALRVEERYLHWYQAEAIRAERLKLRDEWRQIAKEQSK